MKKMLRNFTKTNCHLTQSDKDGAINSSKKFLLLAIMKTKVTFAIFYRVAWVEREIEFMTM